MGQKVKQNKDCYIGKNIQLLRKTRKLTQMDVVELLNQNGIKISRSILSQIENGTYNIRLEEINTLVKIFEVDFNTLFKPDLDICNLSTQAYEYKIEVILDNKLEYNGDNKKAVDEVKTWLGCEWQCGNISMEEYQRLKDVVDNIAEDIIKNM